MKEVLTIHVGSDGVNVGIAYWKQKCLEYGIGLDGILDKKKCSDPNSIGTYFIEHKQGKYKARAMFVDFGTNSIDELKDEMKEIFDELNLFQFNSDCPLFPHSRYTEGAEKIDKVMEGFRTQIESSEKPEIVQIFYSSYDGVGSGFGPFLISKISQEIPDTKIIAINELPSPNFNTNTVEIYNSLLSINSSNPDIGLSICYDKEAIYNFSKSNQSVVTDWDIDNIIAGMPDFEYSDGKEIINRSDIVEKLSTNPHHLYLIPTVMTGPNSKINKMIENSMKAESNLLSVNNGVIFNKNFAFRGKVSEGDVKSSIAKCMSAGTFGNASNPFKELTSSFNKKSCYVKNKKEETFANLTTLTNNSGITDSLKRIQDRFCKIYKTRAWVSNYLGQGMEEGEFSEASSNLQEVIQAYSDSI